MNQIQWRVVAGILALTLGTIVVVANDHRSRSSAPESSCDAAENNYEPCCTMPCPPCAAQCPIQCETPSTSCPIVEAPSPTAPCATLSLPADPIPPLPDVITVVASEVRPAEVGATVVDIPFKVRMETNNGMTLIQLDRGDDVALCIRCDRIDVQMPGGGLHATGRVSLSAPGMEVRCNRLMVGWSNGDIAMEGQVCIICQNGHQKTQLSAESVRCRLNNAGTNLEITDK